MRVNAGLAPPARKRHRTDDDLEGEIASLKALTEWCVLAPWSALTQQLRAAPALDDHQVVG